MDANLTQLQYKDPILELNNTEDTSLATSRQASALINVLLPVTVKHKNADKQVNTKC